MPVYQKLISHDLSLQKSSIDPIILNDLCNAGEADKEYIKQITTSRYSTDMVSILPSCNCGRTKGEFSNIKVKCSYCNSYVQAKTEDDIEPTVWFRKPVGVQKLISPIIWIMLKNRFKKSGFSVICWLTDTTYKTQVTQPPVLAKIVESGIQRGYNNFVENFDVIIEFLLSMKDFKLKKGRIDYLDILLKENPNAIFSDYLPMPNKALLIVEKTNVGVYVDNVIMGAIDAIEMLVGIDTMFADHNIRGRENRTAKAINKLSDFYMSFFKVQVSGKPGKLRRHIFGSRTSYSFRCVISSITGRHNYKDVEVPWCIGLTAFREHLMNRLRKQGMSLNEATGFLRSHISNYNPLLADMLDNLIAETRGGEGIVISLVRNPALLKGSLLRMRIAKFKKNPKDLTIGLSDMVCASLNADFDGDEVNIAISLDNEMADAYYPLEPMFSVVALDVPNKISSLMRPPKTSVDNTSAWLARD